MLLPANQEPMDLSMKGSLHLIDGAGEFNRHVALRHLTHRKSLIIQPRDDLRHVLRRRAILLAELFRSKEAMKVRGVLVFKRRQVPFKHLLLLRRAFQQQQYPLRPQRYRRWSPIELTSRQRIYVAAQCDKRRFVNRTRDKRPGGEFRLRGSGNSQPDRNQHGNKRTLQERETRGNHGSPDVQKIGQMPGPAASATPWRQRCWHDLQIQRRIQLVNFFTARSVWMRAQSQS